MATRMKQRRGTAAEWAAANPILADGEIGFERDSRIFKLGDGVTAWNDLLSVYIETAGHATTADSAGVADDSALLGGVPPSGYLAANGKAADSELLDGLDSTQFTRSDAPAIWTQTSEFRAVLAAIFGDADGDRVEQRAFVVETHQRNTQLAYTGDLLTNVKERVGTTVIRDTTLTYTNGVLTSTKEVAGGKTITTTLNYTNEILTSTSRAVA